MKSNKSSDQPDRVRNLTPIASGFVNKGYSSFTKALEDTVNLVDYLEDLTISISPELKTVQKPKAEKEADLRGIGLQTKSGSFGIKNRFTSRPTTAPGPGSYIESKPYDAKRGVRMISRKSNLTVWTPGPQSYFIREQNNFDLGHMAREPRFNDKVDDYKTVLGPGAYTPKEVTAEKGGKFSQNYGDRNPVNKTNKDVPAPGIYNTKETPVQSIMISKAFHLDKGFTDRIGPGTYNSPVSAFGTRHKFAQTPRFQTNHSSRMEQYTPLDRQLTKQELHDLKKRIIINKDLKRHRPEQRRATSAMKVQHAEDKAVKVREHRQRMETRIQQKRSTSYDRKFTRLKIRRDTSKSKSSTKCD